MTNADFSTLDAAPVCVFAFNRPDHTRRTLQALAASPLAAKTELTLFLDGPRRDSDVPLVSTVAKIAEEQRGFSDISIVRRDQNAGLARSIEEGVTQMMDAHGRAIILEDDILTSPAFLHYMNAALTRYADEPSVWHIAGFNEDIPVDRWSVEAVLWRLMSCWGWATWQDRWQHFDRDPQALVDRFSSDDIHRFNLDGAGDFWAQVLANQDQTLSTWAVFWYATIFERAGLCLSPRHSYVRNIGFDGSGTNVGQSDVYEHMKLNQTASPRFPDKIEENTQALELLRAHYLYRPSRFQKLKRKVTRYARHWGAGQKRL